MQLLDQCGFTVRLNDYPQRIVSLVPSQTELLYHLGLEDRVKGITKFCIHPEKWQSEKKIIGGTKNINIRQILDLEPDLIIANKEENRKEQIEKLKDFCPVYTSDVRSIPSALDMITDIGRLVNKENEANKIALDIEVKLVNFKPLNNVSESIAYLIWKNPLMVVGNDNFIHSLIEWGGWTNVFEDRDRYPGISEDELKNAKPDRILLSSEPYKFTDEDIPYFKSLLPNTKVQLVDGEKFSWYGSRMKLAPAYIHLIRNL